MRAGAGRAGTALVLAAALALAAGCGGEGPRPSERASGDGPGGGAADATEVGAFLLRYLEALEARDTGAVRPLLADDARFVWIEDGAVRYRSADEVLAGVGALPPAAAPRTVVGEVEVAPAGSGAVHAWTPFTTRMGEGEGAVTFGGVLSFVLERDGEGWRIVGGHTSTARPSPRR